MDESTADTQFVFFYLTKHRLNGRAGKEKCVTSGNTFLNRSVQLEPSHNIYRNEYKWMENSPTEKWHWPFVLGIWKRTQTTHMHKIPICCSITRSHFNSEREWGLALCVSLSRNVYFASLQIMMFDHYNACTFSSSTHTHANTHTPEEWDSIKSN